MSDRQAEAVRQLKAHPEVSNREVARQCGLAQATIAKIRTELEAGAQIPKVDARVGRDGRTYSRTPKHSTKRISLVTVLENIADALNPNEYRAIVRYLLKLADVLEDQDKLKGFKTIDDAANACRSVLGEEGVKNLSERLGCRSADQQYDDLRRYTNRCSRMRTINSSTSLLIRGRPGVRRFCEPSNLRATSLRYHAKMVSGRAAVATSPSALRPSRRPISPSFARSASENFSRPFNWPLRIRFSAARYSFRSSSSWSTVPVM